MAASAITNYVDGLLKRVYNDEVLDWFLNMGTPFWTELQTAKLIPSQIGDGFYWPFKFQSQQNISTPAETGNIPVAKPATVVQGRVRLAQFIGSIETSLLLDAVGQGAGAWKSVVKEEMDGTLKDLTKHVNRSYAGTHGTGRLMVINGTTTGTAAVGKLPIGVLNVRPNMSVEQYTTDTGGSIVGAAFTITKIVQSTRTITTASQVYTANQGLYLAGAYGNAPNGIAGLVDDGNLLTTLHNVSRATYEEMKATVNGNSGTTRDLSEDLLVRCALDVRQASGKSIDRLLMNTGQMEKYLAFMRPDRRFPVTGGGVPKYDSGFGDDINFYYGGKKAKVLMSEDVSPRTVYGLCMDQIRRVGDSKIGWLDVNGGGDIFVQGIDSGGYKTTKTATLKFFSNIATYAPNAHFRIDDLSDPQLCGAARGGPDT